MHAFLEVAAERFLFQLGLSRMRKSPMDRPYYMDDISTTHGEPSTLSSSLGASILCRRHGNQIDSLISLVLSYATSAAST